MEGFTVTCNQCGNEAVFTQVDHPKEGYVFVQTSNESLSTKTTGGYGYYGVSCNKCGNEVEGEY